MSNLRPAGRRCYCETYRKVSRPRPSELTGVSACNLLFPMVKLVKERNNSILLMGDARGAERRSNNRHTESANTLVLNHISEAVSEGLF